MTLARIQLAAIAAVLTTGALSACTAPSQSLAAPPVSDSVRVDTSGYRVIHNFSGSDGRSPVAPLIAMNSTLYGTTAMGGAHGNGTVFSIDSSGQQQVVYSFGTTEQDGNYPGGGLFEQNGTLYGTTEFTKPSGNGTVFSVTPAGHEQVLHRFKALDPSPSQPNAGLVSLNGWFYGTAPRGGKNGAGAVYAVDGSGESHVVHSFGPLAGIDGEIPSAPLVVLGNTMYGTTYQGGKYRGSGCSPGPCPGYGTVFSVTPDGKERVLHSFGNASDGANPTAGLIVVNGALYGTTASGGTSGNGTVFKLTPSGVETVLHDFGGGNGDATQPSSTLTFANGRLYGTSGGGGEYKAFGTVFSIGTDGSNEVVLHSFAANSGGFAPTGGVTFFSGKLYGTTQYGGSASDGVVYSLTP